MTGEITQDGTAEGAMGGTELMRKALYENVDSELLDKVQVISSRVRHIDETKPTILWCHDLWNDPEVAKLGDAEYANQFAKFVFVSYHQYNTYQQAFALPPSKCAVIKNAIEPIDVTLPKPIEDNTIRLIYHTTPHRGLSILVPAFQELYKHFKKLDEQLDEPKIHLDVYSSFKIYNWEERDKVFEPIFEECRNHPAITYHGSVPNEEVREALKKAHIFAYPSIWQETSCIAAIEAMSAGCAMVSSDLAALPETTGGLTTLYPFSEDVNEHFHRFTNTLYNEILSYKRESVQSRINYTKIYADGMYNWNHCASEWTGLLRKVIQDYYG